MKDFIIDEVQNRQISIPIEVLSAGTHAMEGMSASRHAMEVSAENNLNLNFHRSRLLGEHLARRSDIILTMEHAHKDYIKRSWGLSGNVWELKNFGNDSLRDYVDSDIDDPIGMDFKFYKKVFNEIKQEILRITPILIDMSLSKKNEK